MALRLGRRTHISWLIAWFCGGLLIGIAVSYWIHPALFERSEYLAVSFVLIFVTIVKRYQAFILLVVIAGIFIGLWRGTSEQTALDEFAPSYNKQVSLQGKVSEDASYGPRGDERLTLKDIKLNGQNMHGRIWISTDPTLDIKRSDVIQVKGKLRRGFGSLAASMFEARILAIERHQPGDIGLKIRDRFAAAIRLAIPEPQASLAAGYLIGQRSTLPEDLDNQLKIVGLTHAVVASGYNLTILVIFARRLFVGTSKYLATLSALLMIGGFVMISGLSPSMSRAALVSVLALTAWYYGLKMHPLVLLPFAAATTALFNPAYLWGDIGWYLSFAAFTGVLMLSPLIQSYLWSNKKKPSALRQVFFDTMSAQLATMPIMIYAFGHYSAYALLANLLVLPLIPLTMLLIFVGGIGGLLVPHVAHLVGWPATMVLNYMTSVVSWVANLPGAQGNLTFTGMSLATSYLLIVLATAFLWRKTNYNFRTENFLEQR